MAFYQSRGQNAEEFVTFPISPYFDENSNCLKGGYYKLRGRSNKNHGETSYYNYIVANGVTIRFDNNTSGSLHVIEKDIYIAQGDRIRIEKVGSLSGYVNMVLTYIGN